MRLAQPARLARSRGAADRSDMTVCKWILVLLVVVVMMKVRMEERR